MPITTIGNVVSGIVTTVNKGKVIGFGLFIHPIDEKDDIIGLYDIIEIIYSVYEPVRNITIIPL